jgi:GDP-L-fucose synthase
VKRADADYVTLTADGTGDQMRDFIHIEDCVDGVLATMDKIDDGDALNLSTGIYTSFKQFASIAAEQCGYCPEVLGQSDKPAGVFARGGDVKKQNRFGFKASTGFRDGIAKAISYYSA